MEGVSTQRRVLGTGHGGTRARLDKGVQTNAQEKDKRTASTPYHPIFVLAYPLPFEHPLLRYSLTAYLLYAPIMSGGSSPNPSVICVQSNTPPLPVAEQVIRPVRFRDIGLTRNPRADQDEDMFPDNFDRAAAPNTAPLSPRATTSSTVPLSPRSTLAALAAAPDVDTAV